MHDEALAWVRLSLARAGWVGEDFLDIGGRDVNGSPRKMCTGARRYLSIDAHPGRGVDVVAEGAEFAPPFAPTRILCCEVLEHAPNAEQVVRHAVDLLAPGGWLIVTAAGPNREPHCAFETGAPWKSEYYQNVKIDDLKAWASGAEIVWAEDFPLHGDVCLLARKASA